jgi:hypothetical protein
MFRRLRYDYGSKVFGDEINKYCFNYYYSPTFHKNESNFYANIEISFLCKYPKLEATAIMQQIEKELEG